MASFDDTVLDTPSQESGAIGGLPTMGNPAISSRAETRSPVDSSLEERLVQLEHIVNFAPIGLCFLDLQYRYVTVNECFARMYDLSIGHFIGRTVQQALPSVAEQIVAHLDRCFATQTLVEAEITLERPACGDDPAATLYYLRSAAPVHDRTGILIGFSVAVVDITERRRSADALQESAENFRYTIDLNPHIPWAADPQGKIIFMSPRYFALTGRDVHTPGESPRQNTIHPGDRASTMNLWQTAIANGLPFDGTYRMQCAGRQWRWMRARAFPRRGPRGEIVRWYGTLEDIHERKLLDEMLQEKTVRLEELSAKLALLVREDHLTGLANRRHFDDALERETARTRRSGLPLALIMIDVDRFKRYNDTYGHPAGDQCLRAVAGALQTVLRRQGDLAARYGGEEFIILLPDTSPEGALLVAEHALESVRALAIPHVGNETGILTISAGVVATEPVLQNAGSSTSVNLIRSADLALYAAKSAGRNAVVHAGSFSEMSGTNSAKQESCLSTANN